MIIKEILGREILDSRGNPTVEVDLITANGLFRAAVPSGASVGKFEAVELRDGDQGRFLGKGVLMAIENIDKIIKPAVIEKELKSQQEIDTLMINLDGTKNKAKLGANAILAVSMAFAKAMAKEKNLFLYQYISEVFNETRIIREPCLPKPSFNIINGGSHAGNNLNYQEFMIIPQFDSFAKNLQVGTEIYHSLKKILLANYGEDATNVGDEGGFAPPIKTPEEALDVIMLAIGQANYTGKIKIALDVAASEFYNNKNQKYDGLTRSEMIAHYNKLTKEYPIISIEDPLDEEDFVGFSEIVESLGDKISIIGDDILVTNIKKIEKAVKEKVCNGLLLKLNQIGTVTEALQSAEMAYDAGWKVMVSHRSGETTDDFIADLAVGLGADYIKSGATARGERVAKYNQLLRIEKIL